MEKEKTVEKNKVSKEVVKCEVCNGSKVVETKTFVRSYFHTLEEKVKNEPCPKCSNG